MAPRSAERMSPGSTTRAGGGFCSSRCSAASSCESASCFSPSSASRPARSVASFCSSASLAATSASCDWIDWAMVLSCSATRSCASMAAAISWAMRASAALAFSIWRSMSSSCSCSWARAAPPCAESASTARTMIRADRRMGNGSGGGRDATAIGLSDLHFVNHGAWREAAFLAGMSCPKRPCGSCLPHAR